MSTFAIGDVQGCYEQLMRLLDKIRYSDSDTLWFTGDLVNRGFKSAKTLRFIKGLKKGISVLGNHDLGVLAIARGAEPYLPKEHTFSDLLETEDREELLQFMEQLPLLHHDANLGYTLVHAGLHPAWDLALAQSLAKEFENVLQSPQKQALYQHLYGNQPVLWEENLRGFDRLRFIANAFTRMRFISTEGKLDLSNKGTPDSPPFGCLPWYKIPNRKNQDLKIVFGHWAALNGKTDVKNVYALDTGCVWGESLTAMRLEDEERFQVECKI